MSALKIQRVRSCTQCKNILPLKCSACLKHPDRTPRVISLYDWPEILETAACGCCIKIRCQLPGCQATMWRYVKLHSKTGMATSKNFYCGTSHACTAASLAKDTRTTVKCSCGCGSDVTLPAYRLKMRRHVYKNPEHCYLHRRRMRHEAEEVAKKAKDEPEDNLALLWCERCSPKSNEPVECVQLNVNRNEVASYRCLSCEVEFKLKSSGKGDAGAYLVSRKIVSSS